MKPSTPKLKGVIHEFLTPSQLNEVLAGGGIGAESSSLQWRRSDAKSLLGFFPDTHVQRELVLMEKPSNPELKTIPAVMLSSVDGKFEADPMALSVTALDKHPLIAIKGDVRFLQALLLLAKDSWDGRYWHLGPDHEKWSIALLLYTWLQEEGKPDWSSRAMELVKAMFPNSQRPQALLPNTVQQKVRRLLSRIA